MKQLGIQENEDRFICLESQRFEWWKRTKKNLKSNPYTADVTAKLEELIDRAQNLLRKHNQELLPIHLYPYQGK